MALATGCGDEEQPQARDRGVLLVGGTRSHNVMKVDEQSGEILGEFIPAGSGGLIAPDALVIGPDGKLYVSTQGSVAVGGQPTFPGLPSQVLRYDITTRQGEVFIDQPALSPAGAGYISLLGVVFGPDCEHPGGTCDLFVSDFANDIRRYELGTRELKATMSTNYSGTVPTTNSLGSLTFGTDSSLYTVGFDNTAEGKLKSALLRFDGRTNEPWPAAGQAGAIFVPPDERLVRAIGILFTRLPE